MRLIEGESLLSCPRTREFILAISRNKSKNGKRRRCQIIRYVASISLRARRNGDRPANTPLDTDSGHSGAFVDLASVRHLTSSYIGEPVNKLPPPDTVADIKIGTRITEGVSFWCKRRVIFGAGYEEYTDLKTGKVVQKVIPKSPIPMEAVYPVVCDDKSRSN